ncbi:MAG TPA: GGDEF domain-containing protein [Nitrospirae bacterium]|nr:GGDEF domain-containing protein [Nitrospirota bacterium]
MYRQLKTDYENETKSPFTDNLTGIFNHGFFQIALELEVKRSKRHGTPFTLALIDIDSFDSYNRMHGHVEGDSMLKEIARLIKENIRETDVPARYSGDVYALFLTKSETGRAIETLERIREAVAMQRGGEITVSIGLGLLPRRCRKQGRPYQ